MDAGGGAASLLPAAEKLPEAAAAAAAGDGSCSTRFSFSFSAPGPILSAGPGPALKRRAAAAPSTALCRGGGLETPCASPRMGTDPLGWIDSLGIASRPVPPFQHGASSPSLTPLWQHPESLEVCVPQPAPRALHRAPAKHSPMKWKRGRWGAEPWPHRESRGGIPPALKQGQEGRTTGAEGEGCYECSPVRQRSPCSVPGTVGGQGSAQPPSTPDPSEQQPQRCSPPSPCPVTPAAAADASRAGGGIFEVAGEWPPLFSCPWETLGRCQRRGDLSAGAWLPVSHTNPLAQRGEQGHQAAPGAGSAQDRSPEQGQEPR